MRAGADRAAIWLQLRNSFHNLFPTAKLTLVSHA